MTYVIKIIIFDKGLVYEPALSKLRMRKLDINVRKKKKPSIYGRVKRKPRLMLSHSLVFYSSKPLATEVARSNFVNHVFPMLRKKLRLMLSDGMQRFEVTAGLTSLLLQSSALKIEKTQNKKASYFKGLLE